MQYTPYKKLKSKKTNIIMGIIFTIICIPIVFALGVMFYCNAFLEYYPISGTSMQPLLNASGKDEDHVYITTNKEDITYGDVIIYQKSNDVLVIKRVIAMPGDNIMIKDTGRNQEGTANNYYAIYIQYGGQGEFVELNEEYIENKETYRIIYNQFYYGGDLYNKNFITDENGNKYLHIEDDEIFYLGDNRLNSDDCVDYGPMKYENIVGEVIYIVHGNNFKIIEVIKQILGIYKWK